MQTEEEKAALEAEQAETTEVEAKDEEATEGTVQTESDEVSKQQAVELERYKSEAKKAQDAAADLAYKLREAKRQKVEPVVEVEDDEERPLTLKQYQALEAQRIEAVRKEMQSGEIKRLASSLASNDVEKELLLEIHKSRNFPSYLSLEEQIEECYVIANKKRIMGENSELKRALVSKGNASKDTSATYHDAPVGSTPALDAEMTALGYKVNSKTKLLEKKLPDGRTLILNPKTNKTSISA